MAVVTVFKCVALTSLASLFIAGTLLILDARALVKAQLSVENQVVADLNQQMNSLHTDTMKRIDTALRKTDSQLTATRVGLFSRVDATSVLLDNRLGFIAGLADHRLESMQGTVVGLGSKLDPVLESYAKLGDEVTATTKDLHNSWDDEYYDVKGMVASATVATTGIARAAEEAGKVAPEIAASSVSISKSIAGITKAANKEADAFTKPMTFRQKVVMWLELIPRIGLKLL